MGNLRNAFLFITIVLSFLCLSSPAFAETKEEKPAAEKDEASPSKTVTDFCSQRKTTEERAFCIRVFKLNPISSSAQNNIALLKIAIDLTVSNAKRTLEFLETLSNDKDSKPLLKPVLQECICAYDKSIKQLQNITQDLEDDPPMSSFDAQMANQQLDRCLNSLNTSKIPEGEITSRHKIATAYGKLVHEISITI